jgi:hypothetical protein
MTSSEGVLFTGLTQSAFLAFGRAVPYLLWFALFPRVARKKRKQMIVKYLAAAGETSFLLGTA